MTTPGVIDDAIAVADWQLLVKLIGLLRHVRDHLPVLRSSNPLKVVTVFLSAGASQRRWLLPLPPEIVATASSQTVIVHPALLLRLNRNFAQCPPLSRR
jgi:hypothetical protein